MTSRVASCVLILLLVDMLTLAFSIQIVKAEQDDLFLLETDQSIYFLGDQVAIILKNVGTEAVDIGGYPPWTIYAYPEMEPVYPKYYQFLAWSLEPGENDTVIWDKHNAFTQSPVDPGVYVVIDDMGRGLSAYFEIVWELGGDVNKDGIVDILDIGVVSAHWYPGPPIGPLGYSSVADINHDGSVDIFDIGIVSAHWGQW